MEQATKDQPDFIKTTSKSSQQTTFCPICAVTIVGVAVGTAMLS
jgi:hypothetical protein